MRYIAAESVDRRFAEPCATYLVTEIEERPDPYAPLGRKYRITATKPGNIGHYVFLNLATREQANTFQIGDALDLVRRPRS
jgi:hypothetical protein